MKTDWILYFGYGSLVNRETRPAGEIAHSARLRGWQRVWNHRVVDPNRDQCCTSLSIEPIDEVGLGGGGMSSSSGIEGVVVRLPIDQLPLLDEREAGYDRLSLPVSDFDFSEDLLQELSQEGAGECVMVYRSQQKNRLLANREHPILQSYIDCVLAGYLYRFGEDGVQVFVDSTRGWECPVFNDRQDPYYPRWVSVSDADQQFFDDCIDRRLQQQGVQRLAG